MRHTITNLNALDMARILLLFEGAALLVMGVLNAWFPSTAENNVMAGALIGILGTPLALGIWHALKLGVRGIIGNKPFTLTRINVIPASFANAIFLILLFIIEDWLPAIPTFLSTAVLGFSATTLALLALFFIYNFQPIKLAITIKKSATIKGISPRAAILAGIYEAIILPIMAFLFSIPIHPIAAFTIAGIVSGFVGGLVGTFIFNYLAPVIKPWIDL